MTMVLASRPVMAPCANCDGYGFCALPDAADGHDCAPCSVCEEAGEVPAACECGAPAVARLETGEPACATCWLSCVACGLPTAENDRLPLAPAFAHTACAMMLAAGAAPFLESVAVVTDNTLDASADTNARAGVRSDRKGPTTVPKPTTRLIETMRRDGYVPITEAIDATGHASSTFYDWIATGALKARRSGHFHFVELQSLIARCPQVAGKLNAGRAA